MPRTPKKRTSSRKLPVFLTQAEEAALLAQVSTKSTTGLRDRAMLQVMLGGGLRVGETVNLYPADIDFAEGTVRVNDGKGGVDRIVPVDGETLAHLRAWSEKRKGLGVNGRQPFFCRIRTNAGATPLAAGEGITTRTVGALVHRLAREAGLEKNVHPHVLRHTYACRLLDRGLPITDVQQALGHTNLATTLIYLHANPVGLKQRVQGQPAAPDPQVAAAITALAGLSADQRQALVAALGGK